MASLIGIRRASSNKKPQEKTKNTAFCKKHPKHSQSPGVCSLCLNEKLSLFIKSSSSSSSSSRQKASKIVSSSSISSLSSYCSSSVSSCPSPVLDRRCYLLMAGGSGRGEKGWMKKSQSVAYKVDDEKRKKKKKKKGGFFLGLVGSRNDDKKVL